MIISWDDIILNESENQFCYVQMGAFCLTDTDGKEWVLGLRDLKTKSSEDTLHVFKEIISDINDRSKNTKSPVGKIILTHIGNTMTDRAPTELKFNRLLEAYINEVAPHVKAAADGLLEPEDVQVIIRLNEFFCGLHSLVHFANVVCTTSSKIEVEHFEGQLPILNPTMQKAGESGAARTVRTSCKAFARGANEQCGIYGKVSSFLKPILKDKFNSYSLPLTQ